MRMKVSHPSYPDNDFYILSHTPDVEAQVNRLGPVQAVATALDWPERVHGYHGWTDTVNSLWWPRGGDNFASVVLLLDDERRGLLHNTASQQVTGTASNIDPRPYVILSAMLAPAEGATPGETYTPAGIAAAVEIETELLAWKLYPLPPVKLTEIDSSDTFVGLWLCPLVDLRYFWRCGQPLPREGGSSSSGAGTSFPVWRIDPTDDEPGWMPPLRDYPQDSGEPPHYVQIEGNGTHREVGANTDRGKAADVQARIENWRVVCRDVRSGYNAPPGADQHTTFTGILADYPAAGVDDAGALQVPYSATIATGGQGYEVGDAVTLVGGAGADAVVEVTAVSRLGGVVTGIAVTDAGAYTTPPDNPVETDHATGTGLTLTCAFAVPSYHGDAVRLADVVGNRVSGGELETADRDRLVPHKVNVLFRCRGDDHFYSKIVVRANVAAYPTAVGDLTEDTNGLGTDERNWVPKAVLGAEVSGRTPDDNEAAELLAKAKQWAFLYWRWRARMGFWKIPLLAPVIPNGHAAMIRWDFQSDNFCTTYIGIDGVEGTLDGPPPPRDGMWAYIDGEGADDLKGQYAWTEYRQKDGEAGFERADPYYRTGTVEGVNDEAETDNPLREDAEKVAVPVGIVVWAKPGVPFLNVATGKVEDGWRFTCPSLIQIVRVLETTVRNAQGHVRGYVMRYDPATGAVSDWQECWVYGL